MGSLAEARLAVTVGASAVGLVSAMPSGPGVISEELIAEIARQLPPAIGSFLLTCQPDPHAIIEQQKRLRVNTIQICDRLEAQSYEILRAALPGISLVQVVHVNGAESVAEAISIAPFVDAVLLDSGNQSLPVKELGGTGRTHDWNLSAQIREAIDVPLFLAGGLKAENVADAITQVRPFGVDVCSGVRTNGKLDEAKLKDFFAAVNNVDRATAALPSPVR
jgi:phosphoribosylanthranilate isomerase